MRNRRVAAIGHHAWRLREVAEPTLAQLRTLEAADLVVEGEQAPAVADDGTLVPPADAGAPEPVEPFETENAEQDSQQNPEEEP